MSQPEYRIIRQIYQWLVTEKIFFFKVHGNSMMRVGLPDIICCIEGMFCGLEVKQPGQEASAVQMRVGQEIAVAGGKWFVVHSLEEAIAAVTEVRRWVVVPL